MQRFSLPSPEQQSAEGELNAEAACILLVEDNPGDARLVREALQHHAIRCELILIKNGERAIDFIHRVDAGQECCPQLIILDLNLPKRPGKEVLGSIRASDCCRHALVAILSSSESQKDKDETARLGASRYLRKPSRLMDFLELGSVFKGMLSGLAQ